jgi:hypothetical protein
MEYGTTAHNEAVELVLLCQKYASKWVFYSRFMTLNGGKIFEKGLIRQSQQDCLRFAASRRLGLRFC